MDEHSQDEVDASAFPIEDQTDNTQGLQIAAPEEKKGTPWMEMMECFSSILSLFGNPDLKPTKEDEWEVPFDSLTDLVYLGSGAQGVVFRGVLRGEMVAVKKLREKSETNIKHLRKLNHENIVRFRGVCSQLPLYCVIMEYCQYGPLFEFLHSGSCFGTKQIVKWAKEIAYGMKYLHENKIIHRDLKSPNILITDNLMVKVSDFGTSREWNDVSAVMSFAGTVAWMAPEMIRQELCSERMDVWSYGVVLWELLTQEVPYKNMETHAIMWGVGTGVISLPVPTTCPDTIQLLLTQCWNRMPRNRPPFKIIAAHLEKASEELNTIHPDCFNVTQAAWRKEVQDGLSQLQIRSAGNQQPAEVPLPVEELRIAKNTRSVYERHLKRASDLYMEVCAVRLQLEAREKYLAKFYVIEERKSNAAFDDKKREEALKSCRCGLRKGFKYYQRQTSSSSDGAKAPVVVDEPQRRRKRAHASQVVVNFDVRNTETHSVAVPQDCEYCEDSVQNNNIETAKTQTTVIEKNGNFEEVTGDLKVDNDVYIPGSAQV